MAQESASSKLASANQDVTDSAGKSPSGAGGVPPPLPPNTASGHDANSRSTFPPPPPLGPESSKSVKQPDAADADAGRRSAKRRPAGPSRPEAAANDDLPSIGGLIFALHQKPSQRPMQVAAIASGVWALLGILLGWAMLAPELQRAPTFMEMLSRPTAITLAATIIIPIALFWLLALLVWRAQELKLMSSAMTEVAIRLAEPDRMAEQQIASVGQAVRRQVNFMNEAVGRALGRANELESMVQSEVASLERAYMQNEHRIRGLLQELSGERHALLNTSDRVNVSLKELGNEIPQLLEKLSEQQVKLARFIEEAGQNVVSLESSLNQSSANLANSVAARTQELGSVLSLSTDKLEDLLTDKTERLQGLITDRSTQLQAQLGDKTDEMQAVFDTFSAGLDTALSSRTEGLQAVLEEYTRALDTTLMTRHEMLDVKLVERTKALDDAFSERLKVFDDSILRSTITIDSMVADKARALSSALETHAKEIGQVLGRQAQDLDDQLLNGVNAVRLSSQNVTKQSLKAIEGLAGQADLLRNVSENLVGQIQSVTNRFDDQGQTIMRAASALETANFRIDKTLQNRQADLARTLDQLSVKTENIDQTLRGYSVNLEGTFNEAEERARRVGEQLTQGAEQHSRLAITEFERLRNETTVGTDAAISELRQRFSNVSREVSEEIGSLSSRFTDTSEDMRRRAHTTISEIEGEQARLQAQLARLPEATRATAESMRTSLQDQLKALEQLSSLSQREAVRSDLTPPTGTAAQGLAPRTISSVTQSLANEFSQPRVSPSIASALPPPTAPVAPAVVAISAVMTAQPGRGDGWKLGELLARASQHEEAPPPQAQPPQVAKSPSPPTAAAGPLNIKSLARALDATTASAIWSRFRGGQRGVMVRSIYTVEGRTTFDEVQRRFKVEQAFRATVESYMQDFEGLLRDADQRDSTGRTAQGYITSDSGRVYLFLAHASGRLQ